MGLKIVGKRFRKHHGAGVRIVRPGAEGFENAISSRCLLLQAPRVGAALPWPNPRWRSTYAVDSCGLAISP